MNKTTAIVILSVALLATAVAIVIFRPADEVAKSGFCALIGVVIPLVVRYLTGAKDGVAEKGAGPIAVLAVAGAALFSQGCSTPPPPEAITIVEKAKTAADVVEYRKLMKPCHDKGKDAGSFAVFTECADAVDREVCAKSGDRCKGAP